MSEQTKVFLSQVFAGLLAGLTLQVLLSRLQSASTITLETDRGRVVLDRATGRIVGEFRWHPW